MDSVLACDYKRESLLREERELREQIDNPSTTDDERSELSHRLQEVYGEMSNHQVEKAPAFAGNILFGLGFKPDEQRRPTKYVFRYSIEKYDELLKFLENFLVVGE